MIVVVVGHQQGINGRQVFQAEAGPAVSLGTRPGEGTAAGRPNRIRENIESIHLNQKSGVTNRGNPQGPFRYTGRGRCTGRELFEFRPFRPIAVAYPSPEVAQNASFLSFTRFGRGPRIEIEGAVEVI